MGSFKSRLLAQLTLAFIAVLGFGTAAIAAKPALPFQATLTIAEQAGIDMTGTCPIVAEDVPPFGGRISGTGNASHLGKVTSQSSDCILLVGTNAFFFYSTEFVLTAANGDKV